MLQEWEALPLIASYIPKILPANWREITIKALGDCQKGFVSVGGLRVICSVEQREGEDKWLHVSVSRADKIPSWEDLGEIKNLFIGEDRAAIQILPKKNEYVNVHPRVLHLWSNLDKDRFVPDFRRLGML